MTVNGSAVTGNAVKGRVGNAGAGRSRFGEERVLDPEGSPIRCLIVDDEAPARDELRFLLDDVDGVQVVGAAATAEEAEMLLGAVSYDVVFLDIRMPGCGGLELAERLIDQQPRPDIVFTTAYPDHAVRAFELSAVDYLLKPFDADRLSRALERVAERRSETHVRSAALVAPSRADEPPPPVRLPIRKGDTTVFLVEEDLIAASAARGYCYLTLRSERVLASYNLAELEDRLSQRFFRAHRSHLVNLHRVAELRSDYRGALVLIMDDESSTVIPVSRRVGPELRKKLGL